MGLSQDRLSWVTSKLMSSTSLMLNTSLAKKLSLVGCSTLRTWGHGTGTPKLTWLLKICASATMTTTRLPIATVSSHTACMTDFILTGACKKDKSTPTDVGYYWGVDTRPCKWAPITSWLCEYLKLLWSYHYWQETRGGLRSVILLLVRLSGKTNFVPSWASTKALMTMVANIWACTEQSITARNISHESSHEKSSAACSTPSSPHTSPHTWTQATLLLLRTQKKKLGSGITNSTQDEQKALMFIEKLDHGAPMRDSPLSCVIRKSHAKSSPVNKQTPSRWWRTWFRQQWE